MKKIFKLTLSVILTFAISSSVFANGLSLNSLGSRALGMGGAFVALSNDATAIYWNPAGLADQKASVLAYFTGVMPIGSYKMDLAGIDASTASNIYPTGGLLANYRMDKLALALGIYVPAGLGAEWDPTEFAGAGANGTEFLSQIGVISISPAVAYQVNDQFSVGLAVNISYAMFDMKQFIANGVALGLGFRQFEEESTGMGFGATIGLKYKFNDQLAAGATIRLATTIAMSGTAKNTLFPALPTVPTMGIAPGPGESDFDRDVTWPLWIGGGLAYKPNKCLTLTLDAQYSQWSELDKLVAEYDNSYWKLAMAAQGDNEFKLDWEDAVQIRLGGEYMVTPVTALRLGYYYDPAPAPDETLNVLFPSSTNHVVTAGFGYSLGNYTVEAALEYLLGAERDIEQGNHNMGGIHKLDVFAFSVGLNIGL
ncbi:MAG: outer membrane protein transport protein [Ignavibacteriae bacterium]|nr:outer membrane protein transport protein [Ignavibacteriota bacterium]